MKQTAMLVALGLAATSLGGCVSLSRSDTVTDLGADWRGNVRVGEVRLTRDADLKVTEGFDALFKQHVKARLDACATGAREVRVEAVLTRFDKANPTLTLLVGGANVLRGEARLIDVATGRTVADYAIGKTIVGSRLAVIEMGQAEEQMSDAFGEELCAKAFDPPKPQTAK